VVPIAASIIVIASTTLRDRDDGAFATLWQTGVETALVARVAVARNDGGRVQDATGTTAIALANQCPVAQVTVLVGCAIIVRHTIALAGPTFAHAVNTLVIRGAEIAVVANTRIGDV